VSNTKLQVTNVTTRQWDMRIWSDEQRNNDSCSTRESSVWSRRYSGSSSGSLYSPSWSATLSSELTHLRFVD